MDFIVKFLMEEDEVQDALVAYRTDPTDENKQRVIETILNESKCAPAPPRNQEPHRIIFVPTVKAIMPSNDDSHRSYINGVVDQALLCTAKWAKRVVDKIHEAGSSAVFVRFDSDEWYSCPVTRMWGGFSSACDTTSMVMVDRIMHDILRHVGNLPDDDAAERFYEMLDRYLEEGEYEGCLPSIAQMVDTKFTLNLPNTKEEEQDDQESDSVHC